MLQSYKNNYLYKKNKTMKKNVVTCIAIALLMVVASLAFVISYNEKDMLKSNIEALSQTEQPNIVDCIYDPEWVCVALHPTDPDKDMERPYSRWW